MYDVDKENDINDGKVIDLTANSINDHVQKWFKTFFEQYKTLDKKRKNGELLDLRFVKISKTLKRNPLPPYTPKKFIYSTNCLIWV